MPTIQMISKSTGAVIQTTEDNRIKLFENADIQIHINYKQVQKIERQGQAAVITLDSGEQIIIEDYFNYPLFI